MFLLSLLSTIAGVTAISGYDCQLNTQGAPCNGLTGTALSQCQAGCTCMMSTTNCDTWCSSSTPLGQSSGAVLSSVYFKIYTSSSDSVGVSGSGSSNNLYTLSTDAAWTANCLKGCMGRDVCAVDCPASTNAPTNGAAGTCGSVTSDGSTCTESCNSGYEAQGSATRTCTKGVLSSSTINCQMSQMTNAECQNYINGGGSEPYRVGCACDTSTKKCIDFCDPSSTAFASGGGSSPFLKYDSVSASSPETSPSYDTPYAVSQAFAATFVADCLSGCAYRGLCTPSGYTNEECGMKTMCSSCINDFKSDETSSSVTLGCMWCPDKSGNKCISTDFPSMTFPLNNDQGAVDMYNDVCGSDYNVTEVDRALDFCDISAAYTGAVPSMMTSFAFLSVLVSWFAM